MASGGKGGAGGGSYNYFGRVAAVVGVGPFTTLHAVLVDGKAIYEGSLNLVHPVGELPESAPIPIPGIDGKYFADTGGYLKLMRGDGAQVMPAEFSHLPNYRGLAVLLFHKFLFGREKSTVPNIEIVASRKPVAPTALVAGTHNTLLDGQCNPVAFLAEIFTSPFGSFRFATDRFVADDWLEAAEWCFEHHSRSYCSPFFNSQTDARKVAAELLALFDGALYFDRAGRLGLRLLKPGSTPGSMPLLDAPVWSEGGAPKQDGLGWSEVPARIDVEFTDRDRKYKRAPEPAKNLIASRVLALEDTRTVSMPHVTRRKQASDWGNELVRRSLKPSSPIKLSVRRAKARALGLEPGMKVRVDVDPEPGGTGLAQTCVIEELRSGPAGPVNLVVRPDTLADATPYAPDYDTEPGEDRDVSSIAHAVVIPLPPQQFSEDALSFAVLATRPDPDIVGMRVFFDADDDGPYTELGRQTGFAVRCELEDSVLTTGPLVSGDSYEILATTGGASFTASGAAANTAGTTFTANTTAPAWGTGGRLLHLDKAGTVTNLLRLRLTDHAGGYDSYLAAQTAGSDIAAVEDPLLLVLANIDANGRVTINAGGYPEMEFCSVVSRASVEEDEPDLHEYTVLRGRRGLPVRSWTDACQGWIVPRASIGGWTHSALPLLLADDDLAHIKLAAYRADLEDEHDPLPHRTCKFPRYYDRAPRISWTAPAGSSAATDGSGNLAVNVGVTDAQGDIVSLRVETIDIEGGNHVVRHDRRFEPTASANYSGTLTFAEGTYLLTVSAQDRLGYVISETRQVVRASGILGSLVTFNPPSGSISSYYSIYGIGITFSVHSPATGMELYETTIGAPAPASGNPFDVTSIYGAFYPPFRIWARAKNSTDFGPWVCADYFAQS